MDGSTKLEQNKFLFRCRTPKKTTLTGFHHDPQKVRNYIRCNLPVFCEQTTNTVHYIARMCTKMTIVDWTIDIKFTGSLTFIIHCFRFCAFGIFSLVLCWMSAGLHFGASVVGRQTVCLLTYSLKLWRIKCQLSLMNHLSINAYEICYF